MPKKWNFMKAEGTYVYPSAHADDGGDINSEKNISQITDNLISKGFVISKREVVEGYHYDGKFYLDYDGQSTYSREPLMFNDKIYQDVRFGGESYVYNRKTESLDISKEKSPLYVSFDPDTNEVYVSPGSAILEGYYLSLHDISDGYLINGEMITSQYVNDLRTFIDDFNDTWRALYTEGWIKRSDVSKRVYKEVKLPSLHIILKLIKNATGNVRGDLLERYSHGQELVAKSVAWSIASSEELEKMTTPYLDLCEIIIEPDSRPDDIKIHEIVNTHNKYAYINQSLLMTEGGLTLQNWIENYITDKIESLDTITYLLTDPETLARTKVAELSVRDDKVEVTRYQPLEGYDEQGDRNVEIDTHPDQTYSIDDIQKRTNPSSSLISSPENQRAHIIDPKDNGSGLIECYSRPTTNPGNPYPRYSSTFTENGVSRLLSRADHNHDNRYILNKSSCVDNSMTYNQEIGTGLNIQGNVNILDNLVCYGCEVGGNLSASNAILTDSSTHMDKFSVTLDNGVRIGFLSTLYNSYSPITNPDQDAEGYSPAFQTGGKVQVGLLEIVRRNGGDSPIDLQESQDAIRTKGRISAGSVVANKVYGAVWNDYAEWYPKDPSLGDVPPGTLISKVRGKDYYSICNYEDRSLVVGVVSDTYGHIIGGVVRDNMEDNLEDHLPIALSGRVRVKIDCDVSEGDLLGPSTTTPGFATVSREIGTIVGKSLEDSNGKDEVLVQVMLV